MVLTRAHVDSLSREELIEELLKFLRRYWSAQWSE